MEAIFFETLKFSATVAQYLSDDEYRQLQQDLLENPECGTLMPRTGGFRKLRWADRRRGKGKRGGLRIIFIGWPIMANFGCLPFMTRTN
jgi:hypothetical protein